MFQLILQFYDLCQLLEWPNSISIVIQKNPELELHWLFFTDSELDNKDELCQFGESNYKE